MNELPVTGSANGRAYRAYLEGALAVLERLTAIDYYPLPLPSSPDETLADVVSAFTAWPLPAREQFLAALPPDKRGLFAIFGHRAATLAVRAGDAEKLRLGLVGCAIANVEIPPNRKVDAALAVFYHCARKLGLEPREVFDEAAQFADDDMAARLRAFGRRSDVTLKQFGWREIRRPEGVVFRFEWS